MNESPSESQKPDKKERNRKANKVLLPIIGILFLIIIVIAVAGASHGSGKSAKFSGTIDTNSFNVVNPATLAVTFHVTNNGTAAATPTCMIDVNDDNYTYTGADQVTLKSVDPGQTVTSVDNLTITKQGAQYITQGKVTCS